MLSIQRNVPLDDLNTLGFSANAEYFVQITDIAQLPLLCEYCQEQKLELLLLGGGSNLVLGDRIGGMVALIDLKGWSSESLKDGRVLLRIAAGENWHTAVDRMLDEGLFGLENLALIPGTVGAAPVQNIGAYGVELKDHLHEVEVYDRAQKCFTRLSRSACHFAYRDSVFKSLEPDRYIITAVTFILQRDFNPVLGYSGLSELAGRPYLTARDVFEQVCSIRRSKLPDPKLLGNAGSFFKNPVIPPEQLLQLKQRFPDLVSYPDQGRCKLAAGWMIDRCGWKGRREGQVGVYEHQALVLFNAGGGTRTELERLMANIQLSVQQTFGVWLEPEPRFYPAIKN
ncbi:UDP-N-acetylmuramate dehydrogenase [Nitrincola sp. MINF-07-Sa-05]|uniref:UDP-N-acetylmuramate dehydrogenase n=1 Tax=Nitrincola salilacus TaxID=3400273 RepID=UPI0039182B1A